MSILKKLDWYIIKKLFVTFIFTIFFLMVIIIIIDLSSRQGRLEANNKTTYDYLRHYALYFSVNLMSKFAQIVGFLSVIFFTSTLSNNTEIVAMHSGGMSFTRFARPYFISAFIIGFTVFIIGHFILPYSNIKMNDFLKNGLAGRTEISQRERPKEIHQFITPKEQINILDYQEIQKTGRAFSFFRFDKNLRRTYSLTAQSAQWDDKKKLYKLTNVYEKYGDINYYNPAYKNSINRFDDRVIFYPEKEFKTKDGNADPTYLLPEQNFSENLTTPELLEFIKRKKMQGDININRYYTELYERTTIPISIMILLILGMVISSEKKRGGIGYNIFFGFVLAFVYVFFFYVMDAFAKNNEIDPILGTNLPNLIFALITLFLFIRRNRI